ncbi:hypothetical protein LAZ67_17000008 [Cordylochernes scorpioides]|uniref:SPIN-DOC-like zinc-finger domain-containing protein n=1 Tax=Cordylochernes scorpioides TaxID=51811 RepID=A0ABY6LH85_9ARAC|nr:hypothetical protein LAZ67_17000008 [Cordylochernes scorpioides]
MSSSKPSGSKTKRKIADEHRNFQEKWELEYFCSEVKDKIICLICNNAISVPKLYNIKRHYEQHKSKYDTYEGLLRQEKLKEFKLGMKKQQFMFTKVSQESEAAVHASYVLSEMIAKHSKPFTEEQEATVRTEYGNTDWLKPQKGIPSRADCTERVTRWRIGEQPSDMKASCETSRITLANEQLRTNSSIVRKRRKTSLKILSSTDSVDGPQQGPSLWIRRSCICTHQLSGRRTPLPKGHFGCAIKCPLQGGSTV